MKQRALSKYERWLMTHPDPTCRALGHMRRETTWEIPGRSDILLAVRYCGNGCGWGIKAVLNAETHETLATYGQTYGQDYLKPSGISDWVPGRIPRAEFHQQLPVRSADDMPEELLADFERWDRRKNGSD